MRQVLVVAAVAVAITFVLDVAFDLPMAVRWLLAGVGAAVAGLLLSRVTSGGEGAPATEARDDSA